jgi:hypothetical protein
MKVDLIYWAVENFEIRAINPRRQSIDLEL